MNDFFTSVEQQAIFIICGEMLWNAGKKKMLITATVPMSHAAERESAAIVCGFI